MQSPFAFKPSQPITTIGNFYGTPFSVQGLSWLPVSQLLGWGFFTWQSVKKHTTWTWYQHTILGGLRMIVLLGSEWCHNLAHVATARAVGKPVDVVRIILGMPLLIYNEPEHPSITPRQHLLRSLAGPICNMVLLTSSKFMQHLTPDDSPAREVADTAAGMNTFLSSASLLPVPVFDGGPILKWSLISRGFSAEKSVDSVTQTQKVVGAGLLGSAAVAIHKRKWFLAAILCLLGVLSLATGLGKLKY